MDRTMKRTPQSKAGPSSRQRKTAQCLEAKFERTDHGHTPAPASTDLAAWAASERAS